jgi:mannose-6-phosphate isomerase-like protein (cupin superfamily)
MLASTPAAPGTAVLVTATTAITPASAATVVGGATLTAPPAPLVANLLALAAAAPLAPGRPIGVTELGRGPLASLHAVQLRHAIPAHYHADHDEIVCVVDGRVTMTMAGETLTAEPGMVLFIPRGTAHSVANTDSTHIALALSCFTPAFDGSDRHAVEPPLPATDH